MLDEMKCSNPSPEVESYTKRLEEIIEGQHATIKNLDSTMSKMGLFLPEGSCGVPCDNITSIDTLISKITRNALMIFKGIELVEKTL